MRTPREDALLSVIEALATLMACECIRCRDLIEYAAKALREGDV